MKRLALVMLLVAAPAAARSRPQRVRLPPAPAHEYVDGLAQVAASYSRLGQWDKAVALYDEVRVTRPEDPDVLEDLIAACVHATSCEERRLGLMREGLDRVKQPVDLLEKLVDEITRRGRPVSALSELRGFVRRHPDNDDARALLIDTAMEREQPLVALTELPIHLKRNPDDLERRVAYVEALRDTHRDDAFARELRLLLKLQPEHVGALVMSGELALEDGALGRARRALDQARRALERRRVRDEKACRAEEDGECLSEGPGRRSGEGARP
jgi:hypothetical protein